MTIVNWISPISTIAGSAIAATVALQIARRERENTGAWTKVGRLLEIREKLDDSDPMKDWIRDYTASLMRASAASESGPRIGRLLIPWILVASIAMSGSAFGLISALWPNSVSEGIPLTIVTVAFAGVILCALIRVTPRAPAGSPVYKFNGEVDLLYKRALEMYPDDTPEKGSTLFSDFFPRRN